MQKVGVGLRALEANLKINPENGFTSVDGSSTYWSYSEKSRILKMFNLK